MYKAEQDASAGQAVEQGIVARPEPTEPTQQNFQADEFGMIPGTIYPGKDGKFFKYNGGGRKPKNFIEVDKNGNEVK